MIKKENRKEHFKVWSQIFLLVMMTIAFTYFIHESSGLKEGDMIMINKRQNENGNGILMTILELLVKLAFSEKGLVSALENSDFQQGTHTCLKSKDGKFCQEYIASECAGRCDGACIPSSRNNVAECRLGTCYDINEGTCTNGAPKLMCEQNGGRWFNDIGGNVQECNEGCCFLGLISDWTTEKECEVRSQRMGIIKNFSTEITSNIVCWFASKTQDEGACITGKDELTQKNICKFGTRAECIQRNGEFYQNYLCSNPELNTNCERQRTSGCVDGKDEVYWIDSCGNRENIYDANKGRSWNSGKILSKVESCELGTITNPLSNQRTCGNCDYLMGSRCGNKTATQKLSDNAQDFVCRDLSCVDEWGNRREHGETWCHYQSLTGVDKTTSSGGLCSSLVGIQLLNCQQKESVNVRALDTPGSRHFRMVCADGEVRIEPCADYRTEICVETRIETDGKTRSDAVCRINTALECVNYNYEEGVNAMLEKCNENPNCFVKQIAVSKNFNFPVCVAKNPLGFNLETRGEGASAICGLATRSCRVIEISKFDPRKKKWTDWKCEENCECLTPAFAQQMNDFCISLGDCGTEANYLGTVTVNHAVTLSKNPKSKTPNHKLSGNYFENLAEAAKENPASFIPYVLPYTLFFELFGGEPIDEKILDKISTYGGGIGGGLLSILMTTKAITIAEGGVKVAWTQASVSYAGLGGALGVIFGALAGAAAVALLLKGTGVAGGISEGLAYFLIAGGATAGAFIGYAMATGAWGLGGVSLLGPIGIIILVILVLFVLVLKWIGVGKIRKIDVTFVCNPWQPAYGGNDCSKCGSDGMPCGKYNCWSLGRACQFVNEGTDEERCINNAPNDIAPPVISPLQGILPEDYSYSDISERGFSIKSPEMDGCMKVSSQFNIGIALNKFGSCRFGNSANWDEMQDFSYGLMRENHTSMPFSVLDLSGIELEEYNPNARTDFNLHIKCRNSNGYENTADYVVKFCLKPGDDIYEPFVLGKTPLYNAIKHDATGANYTIYTNEPTTCRWDYNDRNYDSMDNNLTCMNEIEQETIAPSIGIGWTCDGEFPMPLDVNEKTFYIRCKDKPWLEGINESERNAMTNSYSFTLKRTTQLKIDSIKPNDETISSGVEPMTVELIAKTSGGYDNNAECKYKVGDNFIEFLETFSNTHRNTFDRIYRNDLFGGEDKTIGIMCEDEIGNMALGESKFKIEIDTDYPRIARVYDRDGTLYVVTNENAECAYSLTSCEFDYTNGTLMTGTALEHTTEFTNRITRHIMCKDDFGNKPGSCQMSVRGG